MADSSRTPFGPSFNSTSLFESPCLDDIEGGAQVGICCPQPQDGVVVGDLYNRNRLNFFDVRGWIRQAVARLVLPRRVCHDHLEWSPRQLRWCSVEFFGL